MNGILFGGKYPSNGDQYHLLPIESLDLVPQIMGDSHRHHGGHNGKSPSQTSYSLGL